MYKVEIVKNPNGDTRTAVGDVTFKKFHEANLSHREDVYNLMESFSHEVRSAAVNHDVTKLINEKQFYEDFKSAREIPIFDFTSGEWYKMHVLAERHHLNTHCPKDVTLVDVIEMICDCVAAGLARNGKVTPVEISNDILQEAVKNTVTLLAESCEVIDPEEKGRTPVVYKRSSYNNGREF